MTQVNFLATSSAYASLGSAPVSAQATTVPVKIVVADSQPLISVPGTSLLVNQPARTFLPVTSSSKVWVASTGDDTYVYTAILTGESAGGGGGGALTLTDGTHTVANTTQITVSGATVGGTSPNATLSVSGGSGGLLSSGVISLSSAQLLALGVTAIEIVAAPGANKAIVPVQAISTLTFGAVAYPSTDVALIYGSDFENVHFSFSPAPFNGNVNTEDAYTTTVFPNDGSQNLGFTKTNTAGFALNLKYTGETPIAIGDGTATVEVFYRIVSWP